MVSDKLLTKTNAMVESLYDSTRVFTLVTSDSGNSSGVGVFSCCMDMQRHLVAPSANRLWSGARKDLCTLSQQKLVLFNLHYLI